MCSPKTGRNGCGALKIIEKQRRDAELREHEVASAHPVDRERHKVKEKWRYEQVKSLYANRAFSGDCYYRAIDGDIDAYIATRQKPGQGGCLSIKPETMGHSLGNVCE